MLGDSDSMGEKYIIKNRFPRKMQYWLIFVNANINYVTDSDGWVYYNFDWDQFCSIIRLI